MMTARPSTARGEHVVPRAIVGVGGILFLSVPVQWVVFDETASGVIGSTHVVSFLTAAVPALGIAYGGYWLRRSDLPPDRYSRIAGWFFGGLVGFLSLNLVLIAAFPADSLAMNVGWAVGTAIYGAVGGFVVGSVEARAIERARAAERATVHAERAEAERDWLDYLNSLLRHEVLNTANVIEGQAILLEDEIGPEGTDRIESIRRQSRDMTSVIEDVRVLIQATEDADELAPIDVGDVLAAEIESLADAHEDVEIDRAIPAGVTVCADDLLPRVFSNLLHNAVVHNDADVPRVSVTVETPADTAVVTISDNGPGIPPEERARLFQRTQRRGSNHGLGLYLVRTLVERYGGSVELADTSPDGSTFRVELPLASETRGVSAEGADVFAPIAADGGPDST